MAHPTWADSSSIRRSAYWGYSTSPRPWDWKSNNEDFGQTLGKWGVGPGPYLVIPFMGPSTLRDAVGRGVDSQTGWSKQVDHVRTRNSAMGLELIQRARLATRCRRNAGSSCIG